MSAAEMKRSSAGRRPSFEETGGCFGWTCMVCVLILIVGGMIGAGVYYTVYYAEESPPDPGSEEPAEPPGKPPSDIKNDPQFADLVMPGDKDWYDDLETTDSEANESDKEFIEDLRKDYPFLSKSCGLRYRMVKLAANQNQNVSFDAEEGSDTEQESRTLYYGSYPAKLGELPWHLTLFVPTEKKDPSTGTLKKDLSLCGATLISSQYILTAAHCYDNRDPSNSSFAVPGFLLFDHIFLLPYGPKEFKKRYTWTVSDVAIHPTYDSQQVDRTVDITVARLVKPIPRIYVRRHVPGMVVASPICLPSSAVWRKHSLRLDRTKFVIPGLGDVGDTRHGAVIQDRVRVGRLTYNETQPAWCRKADTSGIPANYTSPDMPIFLQFCDNTTRDPKKASACRGDSGGGLVTNQWHRPAGRRFLHAGIVSHGADLEGDPNFVCNDGDIVRYTAVMPQERWIKDSVMRMAAKYGDKFDDIY